jgi:16S rRNA (cytidine1402-2'-O)-methyltransferase
MLILVPTPIDENIMLETKALNMLKAGLEKKALFAIEDLKPGRRRWVRWGLSREKIPDLIQYNEHTAKKLNNQLLELMKNGQDLFLMSDGGLPAFCDPGQELVDLCHREGIRVTSTPFCNSVILALALSGYSHKRFIFEGFLPVKKDEREVKLKKILKQRETIILMDTPYRLISLLEDLKRLSSKREIFLGLDLNGPEELLIRDLPIRLLKVLGKQKREFVLILSPE